MKIVKTILVVLTLTLFGALFASGVRADDWNKKTVMTFSQPVEIPGQILPAGTYTIKLVNLDSDRHVVQFLDADGIKVIATVLAINNWRLHPTGKTVVTFAERSGDNPEALKAWFYPGDNFGQEFVYPKHRAVVLAAAEQEPVPAIAEETSSADLQTAPIVAVTPDQKEVAVTEAIETTPPATDDTTPLVAQNTAPAAAPAADSLPKTAGLVPLIALLGLASLGCAFAVKRFGTQNS
jgi:predicted naringenin-chalcone synthase